MILKAPPRLPDGPTNLLRKKAGLPAGPKFIPKHEELVSGPGMSPPGFVVGGKNSESEWPLFWSLATIFKNPLDPRKPPFVGGFPDWGYQVPIGGQHTREIGSAVLDYVVWAYGTPIGIRLQSERWHVFTDSRKHAYDAFQRFTLEKGARIIDVFEDEFLPVGDGQRAIIVMKRALNLIEKVNPIVSGTAIRASRLKVLG